MKQFKHKRVSLGHPPRGNEIGQDISKKLEDETSGGWELVSAFALSNGEEIAYFKKEVNTKEYADSGHFGTGAKPLLK